MDLLLSHCHDPPRQLPSKSVVTRVSTPKIALLSRLGRMADQDVFNAILQNIDGEDHSSLKLFQIWRMERTSEYGNVI